MSEILIMSQRERDRLKLVVQVHQGTMTVAEASTTLNLSQRQLHRLLQR